MNASIKMDDNTLQVSGNINFSTAASLWNQSLPFLKQQSGLLFDFSNVTSANSAALVLLLEWLKYAKKHIKSIQFQNLPAQVMSIAAAAGVDQLIADIDLIRNSRYSEKNS